MSAGSRRMPAARAAATERGRNPLRRRAARLPARTGAKSGDDREPRLVLRRLRRNIAVMTVHLLKLAVGAVSLDHMRERARGRADEAAAAGGPRAGAITTRTAPRRAAEILDGGSLYWVIKGSIQARQMVLGIEPFTDACGLGRVRILLHESVCPVRPRPCRPFQGWRYLRPQDAPADLSLSYADAAMPASMRRDLMELCLI